MRAKEDTLLTVSGLGSRILCIRDFAPTENHEGKEYSALSICMCELRKQSLELLSKNNLEQTDCFSLWLQAKADIWPWLSNDESVKTRTL